MDIQAERFDNMMKQPVLAYSEAPTSSGSSINKRFPFWKRILIYLRSLRPEISLLFMLGVFAGGIVAAGYGAFAPEAIRQLIIASISAAFLAGAANSLENGGQDAVGHPEEYDPRIGIWMWIALSVSGWLLSLMLSPWHVGITFIGIGMTYAYHSTLKRVMGVREVLVALFFPFVAIAYGARTVGSFQSISTMAWFTFLVLLAGEFAKHDGRDKPVLATPTSAHPAPKPDHAHGLSSVLILLVVIISPLPFLLMNYSGLYLLTILIADGFLLRAYFLLHVEQIYHHRKLIQSSLLLSLLFGLLAFTFDGLVASMPRFY